MNLRISEPILAIDGGGTRCRVAVDDGRSVSTVETGPANVSTDFDGAVREILGGVAALTGRLGLSADTLPAFVGLAGVTGPEIAGRLRAALPFHRIRIEDDRPAAVRGALGSRDGVIAHCGTGSFYAVQKDATIRLAGGWGPVLGDEASAQWIGRALLHAVLESADGWLETSPLSETLLSDHGGTAGIVRFAAAARPSEFGALAPLVTEHADGGDTLARHVMDLGAAEIARALLLMGWAPGCPVCLTGGIGPYFAPYLSGPVRDDLTPAKGTPLDGALALARDVVRETAE